jgi:protein-S-isoprenylcysteine O-methyltransferase Ste14
MLSMPSQEWHIRLLVAGFMLAMPLARIWWNRNIARPDTLGVLRRNRWDLVQLIVGGNLILLGVLCYVAWYEGTTVAHVGLPGWVRGGGLVVAVLAFWLIRWADVTLGENISFTVEVRPSQRLVREGPYRWVRHPIYLGALLFFGGLGLLTANVLSLGLMVGGWLVIMVPRIPREEALLLCHFGKEYQQYQQQVGRLWPRWSQIFPLRKPAGEEHPVAAPASGPEETPPMPLVLEDFPGTTQVSSPLPVSK